MPIIKAAHGSTWSHEAVIETNPAKIPLVNVVISKRLCFCSPRFKMKFLKINENKPAAAGDMIELLIALSARSELSAPTILREEPPLNISQPSQRINVPITNYTGE